MAKDNEERIPPAAGNPAPVEAVLYIHGKDGCAAESEHYKALFPKSAVVGLDYLTFTPWETGKEIRAAVDTLSRRYDGITLVANSIGAFFSLHAGLNGFVRRAFLISPVVDMEKLIGNMMRRADVTEEELASRGIVHTDFGEDLSWEYLCYVRDHPVEWDVPTEILYGSRDHMTSLETVSAFAQKHRAGLTVMEGGEHWFHTEEQLRFLDDWIRRSL